MDAANAYFQSDHFHIQIGIADVVIDDLKHFLHELLIRGFYLNILDFVTLELVIAEIVLE